MVKITCEACEKDFEIDTPAANAKVRCPKCGDVNIVGSIEQGAPIVQAGRRDRAAEAGLPPAQGEEAEVMIVKPAMFRARPITFTLLLVVLIGGTIGTGWLYSAGNSAGAGGSAAAAVVAIGVLTWWRLIKRTTFLRITTKRTIESVGLFSKSTSEILHKDIRNFTVTQTFWERIWWVGTIGIDSAAVDTQEIRMNNVPKPSEVHRVIDLYRPM